MRNGRSWWRSRLSKRTKAGWDPSLPPSCGPLRYHPELRTAAQILHPDSTEPQPSDVQGGGIGTAA